MLIQRQVLLDLIGQILYDVDNRVLLSVYNAGFQSAVHFRAGHGSGNGVHRLHHADGHRILHYAEGDSGGVTGRAKLANIVGETAHAFAVHAQQLHVDIFTNVVHKALAPLPLDDLIGLVRAAEQAGGGQRLNRLINVAQQGGIDDRELHSAADDPLKSLLRSAQLAGGIQLHFDLAIGVFLHILLEHIAEHDVGTVLRVHVAGRIGQLDGVGSFTGGSAAGA